MTRSGLLQRGLWLEYATLGWNVVGTVIVLLTAIKTGSAAFAGFGLDSAIEIFASWPLSGSSWALATVESNSRSSLLDRHSWV